MSFKENSGEVGVFSPIVFYFILCVIEFILGSTSMTLASVSLGVFVSISLN